MSAWDLYISKFAENQTEDLVRDRYVTDDAFRKMMKQRYLSAMANTTGVSIYEVQNRRRRN